ncbi:hypothetical protein K2173_023937 [Erythroxylum novogranatense]|uniref:Phytosulfokine n=1 Tax=Erythroxylum novogranatense TaxID=1862640 RepID=A0AAV8TPU1_9ROSI|nr:hypothetical protein K2173_023937 [Erythroxylum novogranatense]
MAQKIRTYCLMAFVLFSITVTYAIRPVPAFSGATLTEIEYGHEEKEEQVQVEESCVGAGEDECLLRRSLAAHLDYVYTEKHHP